MAKIDPFVSLSDWRSSLYRGVPADLDRFLDSIDARLPPGWSRDREYEQGRPRPDRLRCYLFDQAGDAAVRVWLRRVTATRVRGGPVQVLRHPTSGDTGRVGELVAGFAEDCVGPGDRDAGVRRTRPAFGLRSVVTSEAETLFTRLADTADGEWPLNEPTEKLRHELISTCLDERVAIDRSELSQWLADSGWGPDAVTAFTDQFFSDSEFFARVLARAAR